MQLIHLQIRHISLQICSDTKIKIETLFQKQTNQKSNFEMKVLSRFMLLSISALVSVFKLKGKGPSYVVGKIFLTQGLSDKIRTFVFSPDFLNLSVSFWNKCLFTVNSFIF